MSSSVINLAVGLPCYGGKLCAEQARMWVEFGNTLGASAERFKLVMFGYVDINGIDKARNQLVHDAITARADWLLMIDADTWVESTGTAGDDAGFQILRMISEAERHAPPAAIVGAAVVRRQLADDRGADAVAVYDSAGTRLASNELDRPFTEVGAIGAAVMAINIGRTLDANFAFVETASEDLNFCRQVRERGGLILIDSRVRTGHLSRQAPLYNDVDVVDFTGGLG